VGYALYYPIDNGPAGMPNPYLTTHSRITSAGTVTISQVDLRTPTDRRISESWNITSANFQTYNSTTVPVLVITAVNFDIVVSGTIEQRLLSDLRYLNAGGASPASWIQAVQWCEAGELYSIALGAISNTRFSNIYTNPYMYTTTGVDALNLYYGVLRIRDGGVVGPHYNGFSNVGRLTIYQNEVRNERTPGASLKGVIYTAADGEKVRTDFISYYSTYPGFVSIWDAVADTTVANLALAGAVNTATDRLYYPNARVSVTP
jgi:hypothetical protein